jgi:chemotaxis regulatin CheY-phosphate phosphatase CheZ
MRLLTLLVIFVTALNCSARVLIVPKTGAGFWVQSAEKAGDKLSYVDDRGKSHSIGMDQLQQIIPGVTRGKQYKPETVKKILGAIEKLQRQRKDLHKQLRPLHDEWQALTVASPELEKQIDSWIAKYDNGAKSFKIYQDVTSNLALLKYKDLAGNFNQKIDAAVTRINEDFFTLELGRLQKMLDEKDSSLAHYLQMKDVGANLNTVKVDKEKKAQIATIMRAQGSSTYNAVVKGAHTALGDGKSNAGYLESRTLLMQLREKLARTQVQKDAIDKQLAKVQAKAAAANPGFSYQHKGFPLSQKDLRALNTTRPYCSASAFSTATVRERAFLFPSTKPSMKMGSTASLPLHIVLNEEPLKGGTYALHVIAFDAQETVRSYYKVIKGLTFSNGRVTIRFTDNFTGFGTTSLRQDQGAIPVYVYLTYTLDDINDEDADITWTPLSLACRFPVRP